MTILKTMFERPWAGSLFCGLHSCTLCEATPGRSVPHDGCDLFVPGDGIVYATPALVRHYIGDHRYQPPPAFCEALRRCPPIGSDAYFAAIEASGAGVLGAMVQVIRRARMR